MSLTLADIAKDPSRLSQATPEDIPALLGELEWVKAELWARLTAAGRPTAPNPGDCLLTVDAAAVKLGVSKDWLYRHAKNLPFTVRPSPGRVRFSFREIEKYIRQRHGH